MPTYQYACTECGHAFEQFQSFSDDALTECPRCQGRLRKLFNAVGVVFKGSGFYRTDSRADGAKPAESAGSSTTGAAEGSTGSGGSGGSADSTGTSGAAGSSPGAAKPAATTGS